MSALDRFRLDGKLALITDGSSGLGEHFARLLAGAGARVAVAARRVDKLRSLVGQIEQAGAAAKPGRRRPAARHQSQGLLAGGDRGGATLAVDGAHLVNTL